jgi:hypothetical protein
MCPGRTFGLLERAMGIEPTSEAWEARIKNLKALELVALREIWSRFQLENGWKMKRRYGSAALPRVSRLDRSAGDRP